MKEKKGVFHPPIPVVGRDENSFELANLNFDDKKKFDPESYLQKTLKWKLANKPLRDSYKLLSSRDRLKDTIKTFKTADRLIKQLRPWLREDARVPWIKVEYVNHGTKGTMKATDFLCMPDEKGLLEWVAAWLSEIKPLGGRIPEIALYGCAEELLTLLKEKTGNYRWAKVGEILRIAFSENYSEDQIIDPRDWIKKLVMRNRHRGKRIKAKSSTGSQ